MEPLVMMKILALNWTHVYPVHVQDLTQLLVLLLINVMMLEYVTHHLVFAQIHRNLMNILVTMEILAL